jgi:prophage antirepressor-like protein
LGYNRADRVNELYARNADEFTDAMTALVELDTNGGKQQIRIFSLRGCHLLAMFARTKAAKEFRKWVLDVLDWIGQERPDEPAILSAQEPKTKQALSGGLGLEQQDAIKALVKSRVEALPKDQQAKAAITCWSSIKSKYGVDTYKSVAPGHFQSVLSLIARLPLGEAAPALPVPQPPKAVVRLLPEEQAREIEERFDRLGHILNPWSDPGFDLIGIHRALRGCHPRLGTEQENYVRVLKAFGER